MSLFIPAYIAAETLGPSNLSANTLANSVDEFRTFLATFEKTAFF